MRILITNTGPWGTGSFTVASAILDEFKKMGHDVHLFFPDSGLASEDFHHYYDDKKQYTIWRFPLSNEHVILQSFPLMIPDPHPRSTEHRTFKSLSEHELKCYFENLKKELTEVIDKFKPDVVECQHIWSMDHIIDEIGLPYFCTAHHSDQMGYLYDERMRPMIDLSAHHAKKIFAISRFVEDNVCNLYKLPKEKVCFIPNGFDKILFKPKKTDRQKLLNEYSIDANDDATLVSFAGKLSKTKGIDTLLQANQMIPKKENIHFLIMGCGDIQKAIEGVDPNTLAFHNVHFIGHVTSKRLSEIHNICNYSVLPSRSEGFGIACLEAMGTGLPVITTKSGGQVEYVVGKVVEKENPKALCEALLEFAHLDESEKIVLRELSIRRANEYSWESVAKMRIDEYLKVL